jgi:hypothetical protein
MTIKTKEENLPDPNPTSMSLKNHLRNLFRAVIMDTHNPQAKFYFTPSASSNTANTKKSSQIPHISPTRSHPSPTHTQSFSGSQSAQRINSASSTRQPASQATQGVPATSFVYNTMTSVQYLSPTATIPNYSQQSLSFDMESNPLYDLYQIGRAIYSTNDIVIPGYIHMSEDDGIYTGPVSRYACRILCERLPPYRSFIFAGGLNDAKVSRTYSLVFFIPTS